MIEFSELRGPNKIFGSFCKINEPNILFGPLISENSIVTPPLVYYNITNLLLHDLLDLVDLLLATILEILEA